MSSARTCARPAAQLQGGNEGGISRRGGRAEVRDLRRPGQVAYGLFAAQRGVHRLIRISPFDSSARRHTSFAQVDVAPLVEGDMDVEINDSDIRVDTYRAPAPAANTSTRPTPPSESPMCPTGIVARSRNEDRRIPRQGDRDADPALPAVGEEELEQRPRGCAGRGKRRSRPSGGRRSTATSSTRPSGQGSPDELRGRGHNRVLDGDINAFVREYLNLVASSDNLASPLRARPRGRAVPSIPMREGVSSLNLATSVAVTLFSLKIADARGRAEG